jgi:GDP-4-dehydro-6-deoxy-D-mannose reductase
MRALITGGAGFVGAHLRANLEAAGDDVVTTDLETDITDENAIAKLVAKVSPEAIYHLAALSHVGESWDHPSAVLNVNVIGTANVLAAARRAGVARVLIASSADVYGAVAASDLPLSEACVVAPTNPYAASKAAAEIMSLQAWRSFGQGVIIARPFNHIGPGQSTRFAVPGLAARIVEATRSGSKTLSVGNLEARRDFSDVRDIVAGYRALVERGTPGEIYNLCSGRDVSMAEIVELLQEVVGTQLELITDPTLLRPLDTPVLRGDLHKIASSVGWQPRIDLVDSLSDVVAELQA